MGTLPLAGASRNQNPSRNKANGNRPPGLARNRHNWPDSATRHQYLAPQIFGHPVFSGGIQDPKGPARRAAPRPGFEGFTMHNLVHSMSLLQRPVSSGPWGPASGKGRSGPSPAPSPSTHARAVTLVPVWIRSIPDHS